MDLGFGKEWRYSGDVNALDYGGKWIRQVAGPGLSPRRDASVLAFQVIELTNMDEACGRDNAGCARYVVDLSEVDLSSVPGKTLASALRSWGYEVDEADPPTPMDLAEMCHAYGAKAPLESYEGSNARGLLRDARRAANAMRGETAAHKRALARPVNAIGSTAAEVMRGDFDSALHRGAEAGNPSALLIQKMEQACALPCCGAVQRLGGTKHNPGCPGGADAR